MLNWHSIKAWYLLCYSVLNVYLNSHPSLVHNIQQSKYSPEGFKVVLCRSLHFVYPLLNCVDEDEDENNCQTSLPHMPQSPGFSFDLLIQSFTAHPTHTKKFHPLREVRNSSPIVMTKSSALECKSHLFSSVYFRENSIILLILSISYHLSHVWPYKDNCWHQIILVFVFLFVFNLTMFFMNVLTFF